MKKNKVICFLAALTIFTSIALSGCGQTADTATTTKTDISSESYGESYNGNEKTTDNSSSKKVATTGEINALDSAISYLSSSSFSKKDLKEQLKFEGYKKKEISYAIKNCNADWNKEAVGSAKSYLSSSSFSKSELIEQLEFDGFTREQAVHGVNIAYK